ncbi:MAG: gamma-glutamyltransferase [Alphaproteobacteria bacterium]|nr:gamma-glutamyltransferase [Alphaproteobacteria bacterium]
MWRQSGRGMLLGIMLALTACGGGGPEKGDVGFVDGFFGGLIADEPRAALVGREVLSAGGTAADAAVAAYFAMAVTLPGVASIGGGGICLVHDTVRVRTETLSFMPKRPADPGAKFSVPGNVRGMFLLHARYGQLTWSDILRPAEEFARSGHAVSRAFVRDLQAAQPIMNFGPEALAVFGNGSSTLSEGQQLRQLDLGVVMSNLRTLGPGTFYDGALGRFFVEAVRSAGGKMALNDLRDYRPEILEPIKFEYGSDIVAFPPKGGGLIAAQIWAAAADGDRYVDSTVRKHLMLELGARAYQAEATGMADPGTSASISALVSGVSEGVHNPPHPSVSIHRDAAQSGASIVAVDNQGRTVACSFTMNGPFGAGVIAPGTGTLLAPLPSARSASVPTVALMVNENVGLTYFAVAGSGPTPSVVARVALDTIAADEGNLIKAIAVPRVFGTGNPDVAVVEAASTAADRAALTSLGHRIEESKSVGRVNGLFCPRGIPRNENLCQFVKDPRSFGLAVSSNE